MTTFSETTSSDHVGLSVGDLDSIASFYCGAFGLRANGIHVLAGGAVRTALLTSDSGLCRELTEISGSRPTRHTSTTRHSSVTEGAATQGWFHWALRVQDLKTVLAAVITLGGSMITEPALVQTRPGIVFAYGSDLEGNLLEPTQATDSPTQPASSAA
ncbi:VOC family protein [Streptomyces sp. NPDC057950]|uniref:VOC family protein n=1 Tax=Streptomyces sp. NPDC057950 TaxID=3346288 RepID=UPI0036E76423